MARCAALHIYLVQQVPVTAHLASGTQHRFRDRISSSLPGGQPSCHCCKTSLCVSSCSSHMARNAALFPVDNWGQYKTINVFEHASVLNSQYVLMARKWRNFVCSSTLALLVWDLFWVEFFFFFIVLAPGAKTIKKNTNSTHDKYQTHNAKQYEVTSFLSTDCELSTETCSKNVYRLGPWCILRSLLIERHLQKHIFYHGQSVFVLHHHAIDLIQNPLFS